MTDTESPAPAGRVDVVVVTYRTGPVLFDCLTSVLADPGLGRLVIVDNGNDADTERRLDSLAADGRVRIHREQGNVGFAKACNIGVGSCDAPLLLLLNPDCVLSPGLLAAAAGRMAGKPTVAALGVRITNEDGTEQRGGRRNQLTPWTLLSDVMRLHRFGATPWTLEHLPEPEGEELVACISGSFMLIRRDAYDAIGGMDERYFLHVEDVDFCLRLHREEWSVLYVPDLSVRHIGGTSAVEPLFVEARKAVSAALYFRTHFPAETVSGPASLLAVLLAVLGREAVILAIWGRYAAMAFRAWLKGETSAPMRSTADP